MDVASSLGQVCRDARNAVGATALDIATESGVSEATISRFERGRGWSPSVEEIVAAYARLCGVSAHELWARAIGPSGP